MSDLALVLPDEVVVPDPYRPIGLKKDLVLRKYQKKGVRFLVNTAREYGGALIADDMGLGKTLQVLTALKFLRTGEDRVLISCPGSVRETWREELAKWVPGLSTAVLTPSPASWRGAENATAVVCSHDYRLMNRCLDTVFPEGPPTVLVIDEAHRLRGRTSKRADVFSDLGPMVRYKLAMTATPQQNRPKDWWQLLHVLFGSTFGSRWDFDKAYCGAKPGAYGGLVYPKKGSFRAEEFAARLAHYMIRREKHEVAEELPPMTIQVRWVDGTQEARSAFVHAQTGMSSVTLHDALMATLKGKTDEALALAVEAKRFLLATWVRDHARQLARRLSTELETPCVCITGDLSGERRAAEVRLARARGWGVVATTDCVAEGVNGLQGVASVGILHALDHNPMKMAQLFARLHRIGQENPVQWYLVAMRDSVDKAIIETQLAKLNQWKNIMGGKANRNFGSALDDAISGPEAKRLEREALSEIYKAMK